MIDNGRFKMRVLKPTWLLVALRGYQVHKNTERKTGRESYSGVKKKNIFHQEQGRKN